MLAVGRGPPTAKRPKGFNGGACIIGVNLCQSIA
jgi:hypothetical protein